MRIALAHDYLNQMGGAERVVLAMTEAYPEAPIYTSIYNPEGTFLEFKARMIVTSFMQSIPGIHRYFRELFWLYPLAFRQLGDFRNFDVVLSSSSSFAKGIHPAASVCHITYCHSPTRFLYDFDHYIDQFGISAFFRPLLRSMTLLLRPWDQAAARRVHFFIANSRRTAEGIRRYYLREARVIYPPIDTNRFVPERSRAAAESRGDYYLVISRLLAYKRVDLVIRACQQLKRNLVVVGAGPDRSRLEEIAGGGSIRFLGSVDPETLMRLYQGARALIFAGVEDFGLAPLEANACGTPVIAFRGGGALESVIEGETGIFFDQPTPESFGEVIGRFEKMRFSVDHLRSHAEKFGFERFRSELVASVSECYNSFHA